MALTDIPIFRQLYNAARGKSLNYYPEPRIGNRLGIGFYKLIKAGGIFTDEEGEQYEQERSEGKYLTRWGLERTLRKLDLANKHDTGILLDDKTYIFTRWEPPYVPGNFTVTSEEWKKALEKAQQEDLPLYMLATPLYQNKE